MVVLVLALCAAIACAQTPVLYGSVYIVSGQPQLVTGVVDPTAAAFGSYDVASNHISNFGILKIQTNSSYSDSVQLYAAGYLEGALTNGAIFQTYETLLASNGWTATGPPSCLINWFNQQDDYVRANIANPTGNVAFWQALGLVMQQFDGLIAGYAAYAPPSTTLPVVAFQLFQADGDTGDIEYAACPSTRPNVNNMTKEQLEDFIHSRNRCSALVRITGDYSQLFMSHATWYIYATMNRIYKHYNFQVSFGQGISSFSSYPGHLVSIDDFYMLGSQMVMLETTNSIFDMSLYDLVNPSSVLAWQRVRIANTLATNGSQWGSYIAYNNSGTYNNQYMIIDLKLYTPSQQLPYGVLTIVEQIPGLVVYDDLTATLERGYWPSYNIPYFAEIYDRSGYPAIVAKYGPTESYQLAPRAQIFRRDVGNVVDMDSFQYIMRYNDYLNDPISQGNPYNAICSRGDLTSANYTTPSPSGCIDAKTTSYELAQTFQAYAVNGPTNQGLPSFTWSEFPTTVHLGQPEEFDFQFELLAPNWSQPWPQSVVKRGSNKRTM